MTLTKPTVVEVKYRAMSHWPPGNRPGDRGLSKKWVDGLAGVVADIRGELLELGIGECMIETDHAPEQYSRLDGAPRSDGPPRSHRVGLWFEVAGAMRVIRCDAHASWLKNLKAIALTLQRNRLLRAYGTATIEEQYGGYAALPAGNGEAPSHGGTEAAEVKFRTAEDAARFLIRASGREQFSPGMVGQMIESPNYRRDIHRKAVGRNHHDAPGGSAAMSQNVNVAKAFLDKLDVERVKAPAGGEA